MSEWNDLPITFLSEGEWSLGQGPDAPDRKLFRVLLSVLHEALGTPRVLEVGFGSGIDADALGQLSAKCEYYGIDITEKFVEAAQKKHPWGHWSIGDVQTLNEPHKYDLIWCRHVLEHVENGYKALDHLVESSRGIVAVSWFIRPSWVKDEIGCVESEGFRHWTYSAPRMIDYLAGRGRIVRIDFDHYRTKASVWLFCRDPGLMPVLEEVLAYSTTPDFVDSVISVPWINEEAQTAHDACMEAYTALTDYMGIAERNIDLRHVTRVALNALTCAEEFMFPLQDEPETQLSIMRVRNAKGNCQAALEAPDDYSGLGKDRALRDARRRVEDLLISVRKMPSDK